MVDNHLLRNDVPHCECSEDECTETKDMSQKRTGI